GMVKSLKPIRHTFKQGNYASQYGAGPARIALTANISEKEAKKIHTAYWKKNWAIKRVAEDQKVINVDGQMWLLNPINGFYYSLRYEKDVFSTLVQGTASYVFDLWVGYIRSERPQLTAQFHDEVVLEIKKGYREKCSSLIQWAIKQVNSQLKLNRRLDVDIQFSSNYSEIH